MFQLKTKKEVIKMIFLKGTMLQGWYEQVKGLT
jgi:hypothetical protein